MSQHDDDRAEVKAAWVTGSLNVPVASCKTCPFFGKSIASIIATKGDRNAGNCRAPGPRLARYGGGILLDRPLPVEDSRIRPTWCPLRMGDITVTATD